VHWKRRGQNTENNGGWTSKEMCREASGMFATIDDPQPIGLRMICSCLRLDCNFPIADSEVLILLSIGAKRDFNCTRCRLHGNLGRRGQRVLWRI
jgi:hypothetical protein